MSCSGPAFLRRLLCVVNVVAAVSLSLGCSSSVVQRYPIRGSVTLDGKDVDDASIIFIPQGDGSPAIAVITDGQFELSAADGLSRGNYDVRINPHEPEMTEIAADRRRTPKANRRPRIPSVYQRGGKLNTTILDAPVPKLHFELKSNAT